MSDFTSSANADHYTHDYGPDGFAAMQQYSEAFAWRLDCYTSMHYGIWKIINQNIHGW